MAHPISAEWVQLAEVWYHEDGSKSSEIPYVDGKRHGTKIDYNEDGSKRSVRERQSAWHDNYVPRGRIEVIRNHLRGGQTAWHDD